MNGIVRKARMQDLLRIEEIYAYARDFMQRNGNPDQWGNHYPPLEQLVQDIGAGELFVMEYGDIIHGVFFFRIGNDPTYDQIFDGSWRSAMPYGTIHRIAGDGTGGVLKTAVDYAASMIKHIRIDTHHDNQVMQRALQKQGFQRRGIIYIEDGTPRIAYDKLIEQ